MGEDGAVGFDEGGVASHAEIRLHIGGGHAVGIEQMKAEGVGGACSDGCGAIPHHGVAIG